VVTFYNLLNNNNNMYYLLRDNESLYSATNSIYKFYIWVLAAHRVFRFSFGASLHQCFTLISSVTTDARQSYKMRVYLNNTLKNLDGVNCVTWMMNHPVSAAQHTVSERTVPHQHGPYVKPRHQQGAWVINECQHQFHATANKTNIHHYGKPAPMQHDGHAV